MLDFLKTLIDLASKASPPTVDVGPKANGRLIAVRDGYGLTTVRGPQEQVRAHTVGSLADLLTYMRRHGTPADSTLFCGGDAFVAVLADDGTSAGPGWVKHLPAMSDAARAWQAVTGRALPHLKFRDALEDRADDLVSNQILAAVQSFKVRAELAYDADLDDDDSVSFKITSGQGPGARKGVATLPKTFEAAFPVLRGWPTCYTFSFRLAFDLAADGKVSFSVAARDWAEVMDRVVEDQIAHARAELGDGWMVVRGSPALVALPQ